VTAGHLIQDQNSEAEMGHGSPFLDGSHGIWVTGSDQM